MLQSEAAFARLAHLGEALAATRRRTDMITAIREFLASLSPHEAEIAARLIAGRVFPEGDSRILNMSASAVGRVLSIILQVPEDKLWDISGEAVDFGELVQRVLEEHGHHGDPHHPLGLMEVYATYEAIASTTGPGAREAKDALLATLLRRASPCEAKYIVKAMVREMRLGASEGMVLDALARLAGTSPAAVRRAWQQVGDVGLLARLIRDAGVAGLERTMLQVGRPLKPMLAQTAETISAAFAELQGSLALEYKLDGARVQIHRKGEEVRIFSRRLSDITESLPEIAEQVRQNLRAQTAIVEGEVIAVGPTGRPLPFQYLMQRLGRIYNVETMQQQVPVMLYLFDCLLREDRSLLDEPSSRRWDELVDIAGNIPLVPRVLPRSLAEGEAFLAAARAAGHEGVMAKSLTSPYTPGRRGTAWLKVKPAITLDLVVVAADWGYGRRHGWLSNYHLAARDAETGEFLVVGKTFKGLTDAEFQQMTEDLLALKIREQRGTVTVIPRLVVEVAFNNIQASPQYASGLALRFARIVRRRPDKDPAEVDTIQTMRQLYAREQGMDYREEDNAGTDYLSPGD